MKLGVKKSLGVLICAIFITLILLTVTACGGGIKVTLDYNYSGAPAAKTESVKEGEKLPKPTDPIRDGWTFDGWFTDKDCTYPYDFSSEVKEEFTLYAGWLDASKEYVTITLKGNYTGAEDIGTIKVEKGTKATKPVDPVRESDGSSEFAFKKWSKDAAGTEDFNFDTVINENTTLYANWTSKYVFEAEYVYLSDIENGSGFSGSGVHGTNLIVKDTTGSGKASNGFFVSYLYNEGIALEFEINSDRDVKGAKLILRLSCEVQDIVINGNTYKVEVNGIPYTYSDIQLKDPPKDIFNGGVKEFADFEITPFLSLKEGKNVIKLITANRNPMQGTMYATAPMVDCIKIETEANLTWEPVTSNIANK